MIPGLQSKGEQEVVASASTIVVKRDLVRITGSTQIDTIFSPVMQDRGTVMFAAFASDGAVVVSAAGNCLVGQTLAQNRLYFFMWSSFDSKWVIHGVV